MSEPIELTAEMVERAGPWLDEGAREATLHNLDLATIMGQTDAEPTTLADDQGRALVTIYCQCSQCRAYIERVRSLKSECD
ncbi:MAG: hypothetical protein ACLFVJ_22645 [Persicimonas sp.]